MEPSPACPCGRADAKQRPLAFAVCCGCYLGHLDALPAPDAESLMRSRYTAYVLGDEPYVIATWHATTRPSQARFDAGTKGLGLEVRDHRALDDTHAEVEFVARYRIGGRARRLHERSRFVREEGRWYYVDGEIR